MKGVRLTDVSSPTGLAWFFASPRWTGDALPDRIRIQDVPSLARFHGICNDLTIDEKWERLVWRLAGMGIGVANPAAFSQTMKQGSTTCSPISCYSDRGPMAPWRDIQCAAFSALWAVWPAYGKPRLLETVRWLPGWPGTSTRSTTTLIAGTPKGLFARADVQDFFLVDHELALVDQALFLALVAEADGVLAAAECKKLCRPAVTAAVEFMFRSGFCPGPSGLMDVTAMERAQYWLGATEAEPRLSLPLTHWRGFRSSCIPTPPPGPPDPRLVTLQQRARYVLGLPAEPTDAEIREHANACLSRLASIASCSGSAPDLVAPLSEPGALAEAVISADRDRVLFAAALLLWSPSRGF